MSNAILYGQPIDWGHPLARGLVSLWIPLPAWSGGSRLFDLCKRNDGTLTNSMTWSSGGCPVGFGSTRVTTGASTSYVPATVPSLTDYTISTWFRGLRKNFYAPLGHGYDGAFSFGAFSFSESSGVLTAGWRVLYNIISGTTLPDWEWTHLVGVREGSTSRLYQNGVLTASSGSVDTTATGTAFTAAGMRGGTSTSTSTCEYGSTALYNRAMSADEIRLDYDLSRRGYPGFLNRVRPATLHGPGAASPPPPAPPMLLLTGVGT